MQRLNAMEVIFDAETAKARAGFKVKSSDARVSIRANTGIQGECRDRRPAADFTTRFASPVAGVITWPRWSRRTPNSRP
jgi:hypothetical protein